MHDSQNRPGDRTHQDRPDKTDPSPHPLQTAFTVETYAETQAQGPGVRITAQAEIGLQEIQVTQTPGDTWQEPQGLSCLSSERPSSRLEQYQSRPHFIINKWRSEAEKCSSRRRDFSLPKPITTPGRWENFNSIKIYNSVINFIPLKSTTDYYSY